VVDLIWRGAAGGRWRRQHKTELGGDEWSVTYAQLGATRHKSSQTCWCRIRLQRQSISDKPVSDEMPCSLMITICFCKIVDREDTKTRERLRIRTAN